MADKQISSLPQAQTVDDNSLFVLEQQGVAMKASGAQWKGYAQDAVRQYVTQAQQQAQAAASSATQAANSATAAAASASDAEEAVTQIGTAVDDTLANVQAAQAAQEAAEAAQEAAEVAQGKAEDAQEAIENLSVSAETLAPGQEATVEKTVGPDGAVSLEFGIPQGKTGNVMYATFDIDTDTGELVMYTPDGYTGPVFSLSDGFLEVTISA